MYVYTKVIAESDFRIMTSACFQAALGGFFACKSFVQVIDNDKARTNVHDRLQTGVTFLIRRYKRLLIPYIAFVLLCGCILGRLNVSLKKCRYFLQEPLISSVFRVF